MKKITRILAVAASLFFSQAALSQSYPWIKQENFRNISFIYSFSDSCPISSSGIRNAINQSMVDEGLSTRKNKLFVAITVSCKQLVGAGGRPMLTQTTARIGKDGNGVPLFYAQPEKIHYMQFDGYSKRDLADSIKAATRDIVRTYIRENRL